MKRLFGIAVAVAVLAWATAAQAQVSITGIIAGTVVDSTTWLSKPGTVGRVDPARVFVGDDEDLAWVRMHADSQYLPNAVTAWGEPYDSPLWHGRVDGLAYVCEHYACKAPASSPDELRAQL